jgi:heme-degrading monooxygenase HmoA
MLVRIVKLRFQEDKVEDFLAFFETVKDKVNCFSGCKGMQLLRDVVDPSIFITYSHWENEEALNAYRHSDTFKMVWPTLKKWFEFPAEAWSVEIAFDGFKH